MVKCYGDRKDGGFANLSSFKIGDRVEMHPGTDQWMMGNRYGEVVGKTRGGDLRVKLDHRAKPLLVAPANVCAIL